VPLPRNLPGLALCALVLAALAFESARAGRLLGANRRLRAVEITSLRAAQLGKQGEALLRANLAVLRDGERMDPAEIGLRMARGSVHYLLGRMDDAVAGYQDALRLEPRPEIYLNLGRALAALGRRAESDAAVERAIRLDRRLASQRPG
jgi:tetratricopeptide (TPR) repeat protein